MTRYYDAMRSALERHGGSVEKFIGDAVMAVFGIPMVHEDDALRAIRAAIDMRLALATLNVELERDWGASIDIRTGVNTGEIVAGDHPSAGFARDGRCGQRGRPARAVRGRRRDPDRRGHVLAREGCRARRTDRAPGCCEARRSATMRTVSCRSCRTSRFPDVSSRR